MARIKLRRTGVVRKYKPRKRVTVSTVKKIVRKLEKKKNECIKLDAYWALSPTDTTGSYRPIMWIPVDYPLTNNDPKFEEYVQVQVSSGFNSANVRANDARAVAKILKGNKNYRQNLKIALQIELVWYTGTGYGSLFSLANSVPGFSTSVGPLVQNSPNAAHTWIRVSLIRAKKEVTDESLEDYLASLTGETANGDFFRSFNSQVCVVAYDKKFKLNDKQANGLNLRIPLKPKTQRQSRSYQVFPTTGETSNPWIQRGKLYLVLMQYHYSFTDATFTWHFLPRYHVNICEWIRDT